MQPRSERLDPENQICAKKDGKQSGDRSAENANGKHWFFR